MGAQSPFIAVIDQGTSSTKTSIYDSSCEVVCEHSIEIKQICSHEGWVEFDPKGILESCTAGIEVVVNDFREAGHNVCDIKCLGITCQRETLTVWNKTTGEAIYNAIGWYDIRTAGIANRYISKAPKKSEWAFQEICGTNISTYFSVLKLIWILENVPEAQKAYNEDNIMIGTMDTWLIHNLTGRSVYVTDVTNASRLMLLDIKTCEWSDVLLNFFGIKRSILPKIVSSAEFYGHVSLGSLKDVPITSCLGDQQAALLGHLALKEGESKCTYGTGIFLLCNTGEKPIFSEVGLITTVAWKLGKNAPVCYALEGSIQSGGSVIKWMRDNLGIINSYSEIDAILSAEGDRFSNVVMVPAFSGLFAPYWDRTARAVIMGITNSTNKADIIRAGYQAIAFQTSDIIKAMMVASNTQLPFLIADGKVTESKIGMQIQADILGMELRVSANAQCTSIGAVLAAGLAAGIWNSLDLFKSRKKQIYTPQIPQEKREKLTKKWELALKRSMNWEEDTQ